MFNYIIAYSYEGKLVSAVIYRMKVLYGDQVDADRLLKMYEADYPELPWKIYKFEAGETENV